MTKKKILFVAAGPVQRTAIQHTKELGFEVYAMDADPKAPGFDLVNGFEVCDISHSGEIVRVAKKFRVDAIMCVCTDAPLIAVAKACAELNLPGPSIQTAETSCNKWRQRMAMRQSGLKIPQFERFSSVAEAKKIVDAFSYPLVLKPTDSAGSRGVTFVASAADVERAAQNALKNSKSGFGLIEEFMPGPEISVEAFVVDGVFIPLCLSEKVRTTPPYLLDREVHFPPKFSTQQTNEVLQMAKAAVSACELNNCPIHMELILTQHGPIVVEMAARGAGFHVFTRILPHVTGVDTIKCSVDFAFGNSPNIMVNHELKGASLIFLDPTPGRFVSVSNVEGAKSLPGIEDIRVYPQPGNILGELRAGSDRAGHIFALSDTRISAEAVALQAKKMIQIHVEK